MSAHRARHGRASGGLRPVSEILARVTLSSPGTATLRSERSAFTLAAATAVGAGTAAASVTGSFPAIQLPSLPGLGDTHSFARIVEQPTAATTSAPAPRAATATAHPGASAPTAAPGPVRIPAQSRAPLGYAPTAAAPPAAPGGTVMASDLHQADASQIAALSRAVPLSRSATYSAAVPAAAPSVVRDSAPASLDSSSGGGGLLGGVASVLSLPSSISGVPISGSAGSKVAAMALRAAISKKGLPYIWGGAGPYGFDCSGLVQWAYRQVGISMPRTAAAQSQMGTPVSRADLRPGDLVFFYSPVSHVGIYLGDNKIFNAYESGHPIMVTDMARTPFHSARRIG